MYAYISSKTTISIMYYFLLTNWAIDESTYVNK